MAIPSEELLSVLTTLGQNPSNIPYVISGRDRKFMDEWLSNVPVGLSCEHGSFFKPFVREGMKSPQISYYLAGESVWQDSLADVDMSWRKTVKAIFDDYADRTPGNKYLRQVSPAGSLVENKEVNLAWHFRNADHE
jgi:trehalose 6-phosphate synthase/phosphatase